jgi:hypothetical protein
VVSMWLFSCCIVKDPSFITKCQAGGVMLFESVRHSVCEAERI